MHTRPLALRLLAAGILAAGALATAACGTFAGDRTYPPDEDAPAVTINIDVSEKGYEPADIRVPAGPSIQIVFRNRSADEYHYRVAELDATDILWLAPKDDMVREAGVADSEHEAHHTTNDFIAWRATSPQGVKPTPTEVHAYATGRQVDVVRFFASKPGKYQVADPLHPELKGTLTVVAP